jgi:hypothetical protein
MQPSPVAHVSFAHAPFAQTLLSFQAVQMPSLFASQAPAGPPPSGASEGTPDDGELPPGPACAAAPPEGTPLPSPLHPSHPINPAAARKHSRFIVAARTLLAIRLGASRSFV